MRKDHEAERGQYWTSGEFAKVLSMKPAAFRSRLREGAIPKPAKISDRGWKLWTNEQVQDTLSRKFRTGILRRIET